MRIVASVARDRIHVRCPNGDIRDLNRKIPGANWSKKASAWTVPLSMDSCRALREVFGDELEIAPSLWEWARARVGTEEELGALARCLDGVALDHVPSYPGLFAAISARPYQGAAARFVAGGRAVLIADTPGLGKTVEAIAGCIEAAGSRSGPHLVCAPATSLDVVWRREILSRMPDATVIVVDGPKARRDETLSYLELDFSGKLWIMINIEMLRTKSFWVCPKCRKEWPASDRPRASVVDCGHDHRRMKTRHDHNFPQLFDRKWGAIIMDESQRSLVRTSGTPTQTRSGAKMLSVRDADGLRIALSGTPMRGRPQRLWGTLNWLRPDLYTAYWAWVERYWNVDNSLGLREIGDLRPEREEALSLSLDAMMIRRTKAEVSPELPPKAYMGTPLETWDPDSPVAVWLPMTPKQDKAYKQMLKMGSAAVQGGTLNAVGVLAELTRLKQFATSYMEVGQEKPQPALPSNKFDWLVQFLTERNIIDPDEAATGKVVVVSQFTSTLGLFERELGKLGVRSATISGRVTGRARSEAVDVFNDMESGVNVMFLNTLAGGVSITLDAADDMVFLDETDVSDDQEQAEDRNNNRRPEERVATRRYWYIKSLGTVDEKIARANLHMDKQQKQLLDGRRGIEYARKILQEG